MSTTFDIKEIHLILLPQKHFAFFWLEVAILSDAHRKNAKLD